MKDHDCMGDIDYKSFECISMQEIGEGNDFFDNLGCRSAIFLQKTLFNL